jgi:hypothetical protein
MRFLINHSGTANQRRLYLIISVVLLACAGCGRVLSAIPRHTEIKRRVTAQEIAGRWVLTSNSLASVRVDGFTPTINEEIGITVRSDGSYSSHLISFPWGRKNTVEREDSQGKWSLDYSPTNDFKNSLILRSSRGAVSSLFVVLDSQRMVLWTYWGDPDAGIDLVFEKARGE